MIQGGDPTGTGRKGESIWKQTFKDEFTSTLSVRYTFFTLSLQIQSLINPDLQSDSFNL